MADTMKPIAHLKSGGQFRFRRENAPSNSRWAVFLLLCCVFWGVEANPCQAEDKPNTKVLFLVARSSILDPFFEQSVVLMVPQDLSEKCRPQEPFR